MNDPREVEDMDWKQHLLAGHAIFTVTNLTTQKHFTYRIIKPSPHSPHFVGLLTGPNNEEDYTFIGTIFDGQTFRHSAKGGIGKEALGVKAFEWLWRNLDKLPENVRLDQSEFCWRCGRRLTDAASIESGYGPTCQKIIEKVAT